MANNNRSVAIPTIGARVSMSVDSGASWIELPSVSEISASGGDNPLNAQPALEDTLQYPGIRTPETVEVTFASLAIAHDTATQLLTLKANQGLGLFRFDYRKQEAFTAVGNTNTVSIDSDTAVVTFDGTQRHNSIAKGQTINVAGTHYRIFNVDDDGEVTVRPAPASDVQPTAGYVIGTPAVRYGPFNAYVNDYGNPTIGTGGTVTSNLTLGLLEVMPLPTLIEDE